MNETTTEYANLLDTITEGRVLPDGFDAWAIRTVRPDFTSKLGYRYPFPGNVAEAPGPILDHNHECPRAIGDGLCAALTWRGMASGEVPARILLLVAYADADVLGRSGDKLRLRRMFVVDALDGERLVRERGAGADLYVANLIGADLRGAKLTGTCLSCANLIGANLYRADLTRAYLRSANLTGTCLRHATLSGANLSGAHLIRADLSGADLTAADLTGANLSGADLRSADLTRADLRSADLTRANLTSANLTSADLTRACLTRTNLHSANLTWVRGAAQAGLRSDA